jgi:dTMP kinase
VRALLLGGAVERWGAAAELLLVNAARVDHVERVIGPALARGAWVVCDRYVDSTRVYQGLVGGVDQARIDRLHGEILGLPWPDLTLVLDLPAAAGLARRRAQGSVTRFERKGDDFHAAVRAGFLELARTEPARLVVIDAAPPVPAVAAAILAAVQARLGR